MVTPKTRRTNVTKIHTQLTDTRSLTAEPRARHGGGRREVVGDGIRSGGGRGAALTTARFEVNELPREQSLMWPRRSDGNPITLNRTAGFSSPDSSHA